MCLGDLGVVIARDSDVASVRTSRGTADATVLLAPDARPGDAVLVHSGHVLAVLTDEDAEDAVDLRRPAAPTPPAAGDPAAHAAPVPTVTAEEVLP